MEICREVNLLIIEGWNGNDGIQSQATGVQGSRHRVQGSYKNKKLRDGIP